MDRHDPDSVALVFGLMFMVLGSVSLAGLADVVHVDSAVVIGATLVLAALVVAVVTFTNRLEQVAAADATEFAEDSAAASSASVSEPE